MPLVLAFLSTREAHARTQLDGTAFQNFMKLQKMEILSQESTDLGVSGGHEQFRALQLHAKPTRTCSQEVGTTRTIKLDKAASKNIKKRRWDPLLRILRQLLKLGLPV